MMDEKEVTTKLVIGIWPIIALTAVIFGFFFITTMNHGERLAKNETNIANIMSVMCKIDSNVEYLKSRSRNDSK